jgi:two-component system phosphate regulon sensor histidine kinase PhoR
VEWVVDLRIGLTLLLLVLMGGALWAWARPEPSHGDAAEALTTVFSNAPVAVMWVERTGDVRMANLPARSLTGLDLNGSHLPSSEWQARLLEDVEAVLANATGAGRSRTVDLAEGRTWHWWVTAWQGGGLIFIDDVTRSQQAEQQTQLLLSDLAHELRTPLATLATHLEVLRLATVAPEIREQSVQFLREETQRLVRLVNNALELGRLESSGALERRPLDLFQLVESVVAQLHAEAQAKQMQVSVEAAGNLPLVLGHADRLKQVLINLVDNSIKYSRAGDRVVVTLAKVEGGVSCAVCDTGPGIAAEHLPHVTRRFYRAVPSGISGSGLGLALAAEIIRQHGAHLSVESRGDALVDKASDEASQTGTCARFVLPIWREGESV